MLYGGTKLQFVKSYIQTGAIIFSIIFQYFSFHNNPFEETLNVVLKLGYDPISNNFTIALKRLPWKFKSSDFVQIFNMLLFVSKNIPSKIIPVCKTKPTQNCGTFHKTVYLITKLCQKKVFANL